MLNKLLVLFFTFPILAIAQPDTTANPPADEDFSQYDSYNFVDQSSKKYCTSKVFDLSPSKLISIGYDFRTIF